MVGSERWRPQTLGVSFLTPLTQGRLAGTQSVPLGVAKVPAHPLPGHLLLTVKPRIISKGTKDSPSVCSNLAAKHSFYNNK